ncbi:8911_t:CDS:10, partial [Gigaspora margarita]
EHNDQFEKFKELVETTVEFEAAKHHHYVLKADFNDELKGWKKTRVGYKKEVHFEKQATYGYCLRMPRLEANCLCGQSEYIELATQRTGGFFTTQKLKELSSDFLSESEHYDDVQSSLVKEYTFSISFADVSVRAPTPYIRPKMMDKGEGHVILKNARQPCLKIQDDVSFISNDQIYYLMGQSELQIITGPNMGGKLIYIRQIGVIALMAQVGYFVPRTEASLCIFDCIQVCAYLIVYLLRVGAGDSPIRGISTFMLEMLKAATILKALLNLAEHMHFLDGEQALTDWLELYQNTYRHRYGVFAYSRHISLSEGVPHVRIYDESFGIHVVELANFPEIAVKLARRKANELKVFMNHAKDKCSKQEIEKGDIIIKEFLRDIAQTPDPESMNYNSILDRIQEVKGKYQEKIEGNPWFRDVIAGF